MWATIGYFLRTKVLCAKLVIDMFVERISAAIYINLFSSILRIDTDTLRSWVHSNSVEFICVTGHCLLPHNAWS